MASTTVEATRERPPRQEAATLAARIMTVYRRDDDAICHARCGHSLAFQGVRGHLEADFYCYACLVHVSIPLPVLAGLPVGPEALAGAAS